MDEKVTSASDPAKIISTSGVNSWTAIKWILKVRHDKLLESQYAQTQKYNYYLQDSNSHRNPLKTIGSRKWVTC